MNKLIQPLPFFDRLEEQVRFKENNNSLYKFLCTTVNMIPWEIPLPADAATIQEIKIVGYGHIFELVPANNEDQIFIHTSEGKKWVICKGGQLTFTRSSGETEPLNIPSDYYYFIITAGGKPYYSELFYIPSDGICDKPVNMTIEAWHEKNIQNYCFEEGFRFKAYFNGFITNVQSDVTDEFTKDGYERKILQRRVIQYNYNIELDPLPNSVAIGIVALTGFRNVIIRENGNEYLVKDITTKQENIDGSALDSVTLTFSIFDQDMITTTC